MITVLITGATGFCACHLVSRLAEVGDCRVVGIGRRAVGAAGLAEYHCIDMRDAGKISEVLGVVRPDWIFHLAGIVRGSALDIYQTNLIAGVEFLEAAFKTVPQARILIVGSAAEYGVPSCGRSAIREGDPCHPNGAYGLSKLGLTLAALDYATYRNLKVVVARPFNLIGAGVPGTLVVGAVLQRIKESLAAPGEPIITVGNLQTERDFLSVEDAVAAYVRLLQGEFWGEIFNICSGQPRSIAHVLDRLVSFAPRRITLKVDPSLVRQNDVPVVYGSAEKALHLIGFQPKVPFGDALRSAWDYEFGEVQCE